MFTIVSSYALLVFLGGIIPVNRKFRASDAGIDIFLYSNGVHTDFVVPAVHPCFDWSVLIEPRDFAIPLEATTYLGIGWGDWGFYLDTPTWAELKFSTVVKALFWPSPTVMHLTAHNEPPSDARRLASVRLSRSQYEQLTQYILRQFDLCHNGKPQLMKGHGYTKNDQFYNALGKYHLFNTCNFWINRGLMRIGVRTALWSPLDRALFRWV